MTLMMILTRPASDAMAKARYWFAGMICVKARGIACMVTVTPHARHVMDQGSHDEQDSDHQNIVMGRST
jgi:hypothetical protein